MNLPGNFEPGYGEIYEKYRNVRKNEAQNFKINDYASPEIGGGFVISPVDKGNNKDYEAPYHWAGVVAKSEQDVVTLENYARGRTGMPNDPRIFFAMYGPQHQQGLPDNDEEGQWKQGTFHGVWQNQFGGEKGALTTAILPNPQNVQVPDDQNCKCVIL